MSMNYESNCEKEDFNLSVEQYSKTQHLYTLLPLKTNSL